MEFFHFCPKLDAFLRLIDYSDAFILVFLSQFGKKCVPLPTVVGCLLQGTYKHFATF
jgi:hypothetical protein